MTTNVEHLGESQHDAKLDVMRRYPLATKTGIEMMFAMLLHDGAMCPKCGYGTRNTSKNWARCKKCGERVARNGA